MSLFKLFEKKVSSPLDFESEISQYLKTNNLHTNDDVSKQLLKELSDDNSNVDYALSACETHVVTI